MSTESAGDVAGAKWHGLPLQMVCELRRPDAQRTGWETNADLMRDAADQLELAAAEIDRLRACVEADGATMSRMAEGWSNAIELGLLPPQHVAAASILRDEARARLAARKEAEHG